MAGTSTLTFTDANFDKEVLQSNVPVLVDFWAEWCGPCRAIAPSIDEIAQEFEGRAKVGKLDIDSNQQIALKFGIQSIPTLLIFKGGQVAQKLVGGRPKKQIADAVASVL
ncbi:MAG: thioredoxin [Phycisphaeraceae bacterium]|nr:thioredoxin [Phycisphaeraceae bacterium]